jgi:hypothetical protein
MNFHFLPSSTISIVPILISSVVCFSLGTFWYSKALFGAVWLKYIGRTEAEIQNNALRYFLFAYCAVLLEAFVMAHVVDYLHAKTMSQGVLVGIIVWIGFSVPTSAFSYMLEHRSRKLLLIHSGYFLTMFIISATLLAIWR